MNFANGLIKRRTARLTVLFGTASLLAIANASETKAQGMEEGGNQDVSEQVLITGSLIHGAAAVGVPVLGLGQQDFQDTGAITTSDLFKNVPYANTPSFQSSTDGGAKIEQTEDINIRGLSGKGSRTLMLIDGMRYPGQGDSGCQIDPSIIPQLALSRVDTLADGASAVYGSDAIAGVINVILKRDFDGSVTQVQFGVSPDIGNAAYRFSELFGRTWDGGDVTVTYEWYNQNHVEGSARSYYTLNFNAAAGVDNRTSLVNSMPGVIVYPVTINGKLQTTPQLPVINGQQIQSSGYLPGTTAPNIVVPGTYGTFSATTGTGCGNCYAIPASVGPGVAPTWAAITGNNPNSASYSQNVQNPYQAAWEEPGEARNAIVVTFDQKVMTDVSLFADAFYDNRRSVLLDPDSGSSSPSPAQNNALQLAVNTGNPYFPIGSPYTQLLVDYDLFYEMPIQARGNELAGRYDGGFNLNLPFGWTGKIFASVSQDEEVYDATGAANPNNVSAALGWTVPAGTVLASFTKPSNVPYLNVFCDAALYTCNSPATLNYISGYLEYFEEMIIHEYGLNADGTLFSLPAGDVKAAIGGTFDEYSYLDWINSNYNTQGIAQITMLRESERREVAAVFGQLNVPLVSEAMNIPLVQKLNLEGSIRYDHYNLYGGTTNPRVAADWTVYDGFTVQSSWGTSFRAPSFQESGYVSGTLIQPINSAAGASSNNTGMCTSAEAAAGAAPAGSIAALLNPTCGSSLQFQGGISLSNGAGIAAAVRPASFTLTPETSQSISEGFEWAPTDNVFKGLDLQFTYYYVRIRNKIQGCSGNLYDPNTADCYVTATTDDGAPNTLSNFQAQVIALLTNGRSQLSGVGIYTNITFIKDGAIRNIGWQTTNGIDFNDAYSWDMGDLGSWNIGVLGEYILDNVSSNGPGEPAISVYNTPVSGERDSGGRLRYRAHLGWTGGEDDAWSITGFMNFIPHFNANGGAVPPECFVQGAPACDSSGSVNFAEYTGQYPTLSNYIPGLYTFDLSLGYRTGDRPASDYLKNLQVQLVITDLFDKQPPYMYSVATSGNSPHAYDNALSVDGRFISITLTKSF